MDILTRLIDNLLANRQLLLLLLVFYLMSSLALRRAAGRQERTEPLWDIAFWAGVGALVGGRLIDILPHVDSYIRHPLDLLRVNFGLHLYGGLLGGMVGAMVTARRRRVPLVSVAALAAPFLPLGIALERFGCLLSVGACSGRLIAAPVGILLPGLTQPRYPSHLYEGLLALALVGAVLLVERRGTMRLEVPLLVGLAGYGLVRALVDTTRIGWPEPWLVADVGVGLALTAGASVAIWLGPRIGERQGVRRATVRRRPTRAGRRR